LSPKDERNSNQKMYVLYTIQKRQLLPKTKNKKKTEKKKKEEMRKNVMVDNILSIK